MEALFWITAAAVFYVIFGYPICLIVCARLFGREADLDGPRPTSFSFLIAALNEEASIRRKVENCLSLADSGGYDVQVVVVSDGSTDRTVDEVRAVEDDRVKVVERGERSGKAIALNSVLHLVEKEIVIFTDANSIVARGALEAIADRFRDERVGGVCGEIEVAQDGDGAIGRGESLYWTYDQAMKRAEDRLGGAVSAQGSFYAIRREFVAPLRPDCADDFFNSVRVVMMGARLAFEPRARATEHVTEQARREMGRRIRSTERGWRALLRYSRLLNPLRHGWYAWQLLSHKFLRRLMPFFLVALFLLSLALMPLGGIYALLAWSQILFYAAIALATLSPAFRMLPIIRHVFYFAMSNTAMAIGLIRFMLGHRSSMWTPVRD